MTAPPLNAFAQRSYEWLAPIGENDADTGYVLAGICGGIGIMFDEVEQLVRARPGRQPWQQALDIDTCPDFQIRWLGQVVGVPVSTGVDADVQRAQVKAEAGFYRGGIGSLIAAIQATLMPVPPDMTGRVLLEERSSDAWTLIAVTDPAETPDSSATNRAAQAAKVAGLILTVVQRSVPVIDDGTRVINSAAGGVTIDAVTFADVT